MVKSRSCKFADIPTFYNKSLMVHIIVFKWPFSRSYNYAFVGDIIGVKGVILNIIFFFICKNLQF